MKKQFLEKLIQLLKVRSIITIALTIGLLVGWFKKMIPTEQFLPYVTMVLTFYFAKPEKKDEGGE